MDGWRSQRIRRISSLPTAHRVRAGTLLLANTDLLEPTFRRSVIYIVEHNDGGTLGVVLNRPSETAVYNVLPQWAKLATKPKTMFIGGPVKRDAALCLATLRVGHRPDRGAGHPARAGPDGDGGPRRRTRAIAPMVEGCGSSPATRAGRSASSRARSSATTGSCCRRCHLMCSSSRGWICGRGCCAVNRCRCRCWRRTRSTSAATSALRGEASAGDSGAVTRTDTGAAAAAPRRALLRRPPSAARRTWRSASSRPRRCATAPTTQTITTTSAGLGLGRQRDHSARRSTSPRRRAGSVRPRGEPAGPMSAGRAGGDNVQPPRRRWRRRRTGIPHRREEHAATIRGDAAAPAR